MPGGHLCFLQPGVEVSFEVIPDLKRCGEWRATNVRLEDENVALPDREEGRVTHLQNRVGWAQRNCGCQVYLHMKEIRSLMPRPLRVGDEIIFTPFDTGRAIWSASQIEVVVPLEEIQQAETNSVL